MLWIGITGGVGSGKSEVLSYIEKTYKAKILLADQVANELKKPGNVCYDQVTNLLGTDILKEDLSIDNTKMAARIFSDAGLLKKINDIIHPAVRTSIFEAVENARKEGHVDFFFLEAALLIEEGYTEVVDEMWYVYADLQTRRDRLKASRGYSDEKIDAICSKQKSEQDFRKYCSFVLDNSNDFEYTKTLIDQKMGEYLCKRQN